MVVGRGKTIIDAQSALVKHNRRFQLTGFEFEIA